mmetsp:Transcript_9109/g.15945  ORF Transcript_9109/g.15945 Transcript_9109/m.15945 type:complete len:324 (+) Transcript_9109:150-1121(+)
MTMFNIKKMILRPSAASTDTTEINITSSSSPSQDAVATSSAQRQSSASMSSSRRSHRDRHGRHSTSRQSHTRRQGTSTMTIPPASRAALDSLFHVRLRGDARAIQKHGGGNDECVICAEPFQNNDVVTSLPCGHMHHSDCIMGWLSRKCTCPSCRYELPTDDPEFERQRRRRQRKAKEQQKAAAAAASVDGEPLSDSSCGSNSNNKHHRHHHESMEREEDELWVLQGLEDLLAQKRDHHTVFRNHENFDLIMKRTLRLRREIEQEQAQSRDTAGESSLDPCWMTDKNNGGKADQSGDSSLPSYCDHSEFLALYAGYQQPQNEF